MTRFLLNDRVVSTSLPPGLPLLDLIRYHENLKGTKIGCREGDCGACTVLVGSLLDGNLKYRSMTSCLLPLANVEGKHVVTIEGLNCRDGSGDLNFIQNAMAAEGATQCGFCTPGFVVSLSGYCLNGESTYKKAIAAIDGNICRCTGYKSIERAAQNISTLLTARENESPLEFAVRKNLVPSYFTTVIPTLESLAKAGSAQKKNTSIPVGGGTDLYVQKPEELVHSENNHLFDSPQLKNIKRAGDRIILGSAVTVTHLLESKLFNGAFPSFQNFAKLISSTPIRNMATIGGNLVNASPIGDLSIYFLALDAMITLRDAHTEEKRELALKEFFIGYKKMDKRPSELLESISFTAPAADDFFHFEKVSKRTHLDIASVNTAICLRMKGNIIGSGAISAGGVSPVPHYLEKASSWLEGKNPTEELAEDIVRIALEEISPISDARGTKEYKSLLLSQLIRAHFYTFLEQRKSNA